MLLGLINLLSTEYIYSVDKGDYMTKENHYTINVDFEVIAKTPEDATRDLQCVLSQAIENCPEEIANLGKYWIGGITKKS